MKDLSRTQEEDLIKRCKQDPVFFAEEVLGLTLWAKQKEILRSICKNANTCIASGHGIGKTFIMAVAVLWFLYTHKDSKVITTAPTARQVENILWAAIRDLHAKSKISLGGKVLKLSITLDEEWFAMGFSTDDAEKFQGHHAEDILVVFDEAPGVPATIYEASNGLLTTKGAKWVLIGNPTSSSGNFADKFKDSHWNKISISCYESPAVKNPQGWPKLTTQKWIDERKEEWGETSPLFISRVLGQFPEEGEDTLIPLSWIVKASRNDKIKAKSQVWLGVDVAQYGNAKTVITRYSNGKVLEKQRTHAKKDLMEVCGLVVKEAMNSSPGLMCITIDDTGLGGGVTSRLRELGYPVNPMSFVRRPKRPQQFKGLRDEAYWELREMFRAGEIAIPDDGELISQLSAFKYKVDSRNRIVIETKDDMRKRGLKSPDKADSLMIAVYGSKRMFSSQVNRMKAYVPKDMVYY